MAENTTGNWRTDTSHIGKHCSKGNDCRQLVQGGALSICFVAHWACGYNPGESPSITSSREMLPYGGYIMVCFQRTRKLAPLSVVLLLALGLRLWNINFGLPYLYHPDEPRYINTALHLFQTGNIDPHAIRELSINSFVYVVNALAYGGYFLAGKILGVFASPDAITPLEMVVMASGRAPFPSLVLYSRLLTMLFGLGAILLLYGVGRDFAQSELAGILAALGLAVSPGNVLHSKFVVGDEMVVFFVCLSLWAAIRIAERGKSSDYLLAGAAFGFALSAKLTGAIVLLPIGLAHLFRYRLRAFHQRRIYMAGIAALVAFVATTPFVLVDPFKVYADWQSESFHYGSSHAGIEGDTIAWYLRYLWEVEGPVTLLGLLGLLLALYRRSSLTIILGSLLVAYVAIVGTVPVRNDRTILPILPLLLLFAAYLAAELWHRAQTWRSPFRLLALSALVVVAASALGWPLQRSIQKNVEIGSTDGRALAQVWIAENLPHGAKVAVESYSPFVDPALYQVQGFYQITHHAPEWYVDEGFDYLIFSQGMFGRFFREPDRYALEMSQYQRFFEEFTLIEQFEDSGYSLTFVDGGYEVRIYSLP